MTELKAFPARVLLTVTTGRLLTESRPGEGNGIADLYALLGWMASDDPFTHQLPRFMEECKPWLLKWFPELAISESSLAKLDRTIEKMGAETGVGMWLGSMLTCKVVKAEYAVPKIPAADHVSKDPITEFAEMRNKP